MQPAARVAVFAAVLACALPWVMPAGVHGQQAPPAIPDEAARKILDLALRNIQRALCDGFNQCTPATPDELENPPITLDQARVAMVGGARSAYVGWCGFDVDRRSFLPLMRQLRQSKMFHERHLALMAVIHGIQQSITTEQLKARGECDENTRKQLDAQLPKT
jgi:hypothetical protein